MTKAVMTIHGFLTDVNDFGILYDYFDSYDCVHKCKIPGHNPPDFAKYNVGDTLATVVGDFDQLKSKYDTVDVVGFSMGGALTSYLLSKRGEQIRRAVMVAPSNKYFNFQSVVKMALKYFETYNEVYRETNGDFKERLRLADEAVKPFRNNSAVSLRIAMRQILPHLSPKTYGTFKDLMNICNKALEEKGTISTSSLICWGKMDELVPHASIEYVQSHLTNFQVNLYDDVGHAILMSSKNKQLDSDIQNFLLAE